MVFVPTDEVEWWLSDGHHPFAYPSVRPSVPRGFRVFYENPWEEWPKERAIICIHDDVIKWKHFPVTGHLCGEFTGPCEFPAQRPVTRSFDVFFDLRPNKWLSKQWWGWWFETLSSPLWRHCNVIPVSSENSCIYKIETGSQEITVESL